jgi:hypothetical protein
LKTETSSVSAIFLFKFLSGEADLFRTGHVDGIVTGWLPAEESDFVSEVTKEPAALWHVQFDTDEVAFPPSIKAETQNT